MSDGVSLYVKDAWHSYDMHTYQTERQPEGLTGYLFEFARMRSSSRGLTAEVKVFQTYNGTETVDAPTQMYGPVEFNLLSGSWRNKAGIVGALQHGLPEFEWLDILQHFPSRAFFLTSKKVPILVPSSMVQPKRLFKWF